MNRQDGYGMALQGQEAAAVNKWETESDRWEAENMLIIRNSYSGHLCGYLAVPEGHPWRGQPYDECRVGDEWVEVHGGLTYSEDHAPNEDRDGNWWVGFDCAHAGDLSPMLNSRLPQTYRDMEFVKNELMKLAKQAVRAVRYRRTAA